MPDKRKVRLVTSALFAGLLALAACRDTGGEGEYFEIDGKLFVLIIVSPPRPTVSI